MPRFYLAAMAYSSVFLRSCEMKSDVGVLVTPNWITIQNPIVIEYIVNDMQFCYVSGY